MGKVLKAADSGENALLGVSHGIRQVPRASVFGYAPSPAFLGTPSFANLPYLPSPSPGAR